MLFDSTSVRLERQGQVGTLWLKRSADLSAALSGAVLTDLDQALGVVEVQTALDCLVVRSVRPDAEPTAVAADELLSPVDRLLLAQLGQRVCRRLADLAQQTPTVAVIEGPCVDVGLELALACRVRLAIVGPRLWFGFPGVRRGLVPFCGGTARLVGCVGTNRAWRMLAGGLTLTAVQAERWGLVDRLTTPARLEIELWQTTEAILSGSVGVGRRRSWVWERPWSMPFRFGHRSGHGSGHRSGHQASHQFEHRSEQSMTRQERLGRIFQALWQDGPLAAESAERQAFAESAQRQAFVDAVSPPRRPRLVGQSTSGNSVSIRQQSRMFPVLSRPRQVAVVGAGRRGLSLAIRFAEFGASVSLIEACPSAVAAARSRLADCLDSLERQGKLHPSQTRDVGARIDCSSDWASLADAQMVCEAVTPETSVRREVFAQIVRQTLPTTLLVTTAMLPTLDKVGLPHDRLGWTAGLLLTPEQDRPIELRRFAKTYASTTQTLLSWFAAWGAGMVEVQDSSAGVWPSVVVAYLNQAVCLIAEGVSIEAIDGTMQGLGAAVGPLLWLDQLGLERVAEWARLLQGQMSLDCVKQLLECERVAPSLRFYQGRGTRLRASEQARRVVWHVCGPSVCGHYATRADVAERLLLSVVNAAAGVLATGEGLDPASVDAVLTQLPLWPDAQIGPLRWAEQAGLANVLTRLRRLTQRCGQAYEPCLELVRRADAAEPFFDTPQSVAGGEVNRRLVESWPLVQFS